MSQNTVKLLQVKGLKIGTVQLDTVKSKTQTIKHLQ
jgi:hypothetical protein